MITSSRRIFYLLVFGFLLFSFVARLSLTFNRSLDPDEFEHLHAAWMVSQGHVPYKDFWENHPPLFYYLLAPLIRFFGEGIPVILVLRLIHSFAGILILFLTYVLARSKHDFDTSLLAVLILTYSVIFLQRTIDIRPDHALVLLWLLSLLISLPAFSHPKIIRFVSAGFLLGIGFLFSPKALFPYSAMMLTFFACWWLQEPRELARIFACLFSYTFGFVLPLAGCLLFFYYQDGLKEFWECVIVQNFSYPDLFWPTYLLRPKNLSFYLLSLTGMGMTFFELKRNHEVIRGELPFFIPGAFLLINFLFFMRAPFPQSSLLFLPILSIYGAKALKRSLDPVLNGMELNARSRLFLAFTLSMALLFPCIGHFPARPFHVSNVDQFDKIRFILNFTDLNEPIFDGNSAYIFRPHAFPYSYLSHGVRWRMDQGVFKEKIPNRLRATGCRIVMFDERVAWLSDPVKLFLRQNYVRTLEPSILFVGKQLFAKDFTDHNATFSILVTAKYAVYSKGTDVALLIDGKPTRRACFLKRGEHLISYSGGLKTVILRAFVTPASRKQKFTIP